MKSKEEEINTLKKENQELKDKLIEKEKAINNSEQKLIDMQQKLNQQLDEERKIINKANKEKNLMKASVIAFDDDNNGGNNLEKKDENNGFPLSEERKSNAHKEQIYNNYKILKDENKAVKETIKSLKEELKSKKNNA